MTGAARTAIGVETIGMTMRFGAFTALDEVTATVPACSFHALLGENGAGKSTLVKCMMGFYQPTDGQMLVADREAKILSPRDAAALGLGMVYQHFTLVHSLTGAENLVISRERVPAVIDWRKERADLAAIMERMPFKLPLDVPVRELAAGEKQKLEIVKQLYLGRTFLVLDEPTSVLTPGEADEVLGLLGEMASRGEITVLMISHKFREVKAFCDSFTVLRRGRLTGTGDARSATVAEMSRMMIGDTDVRERAQRRIHNDQPVVLELAGLCAQDEEGRPAIDVVNLKVRAGEIVGS